MAAAVSTRAAVAFRACTSKLDLLYGIYRCHDNLPALQLGSALRGRLPYDIKH